MSIISQSAFLIWNKAQQAQQAANSLPLAREHLSDVNNKPISIPHLEQGYHWNITIFI